MSRLTIYRDDAPRAAELDTADEARIREGLAGINVRFERWPALRPLASTDQDEDVLAAYRPEIQRLERAQAYQAVDVLRCAPDHPQREQLRAKFLAEHTHDDDEVRFFVEGAAMFYLHAAARVHMVLCERNDLISVPAGMRHWFDMGPEPHFTVIRLFTTPEGWVARFTGDPIATRFPAFARQAA
jgi:1,2-dihydroxy-3-keto-5-methylthiopentene dioxygenase